jgi:hypothetical protein
MAETNEKNVEKDLYEVRERLTKIAIQFDTQGKLSAKELRAKAKMAWRGSEEIEEMCKMFVTFVTTPALQTAEGLAVASHLVDGQGAGSDGAGAGNGAQADARSLAGS